MPKVSVILPFYNSASTLKETLESVLNQTFTDFEIIAVDDGSTDNSKEIIARCSTEHPGKIRYIYQANAGPAAARNNAIINALGEYVAFLDADDLWTKDKLQIQTEFMDKNPELGFSYTETFVIDTDGKQIGHWKKHERVETFECLYNQNFIYILTVMIRKSCLGVIGLQDNTLFISADYDLWLRLAKKFPFRNIPLPLASYRVHANNISKNLNLRLRNNLTLLSKPEISGDLAPSVRIRRRANAYVQFGEIYRKNSDYWNAGLCYLMACLTLPYIGRYYWSQETAGKRFTLPYRILKFYGLGIYYLLKGIPQKLSRQKTNYANT